MARLGTKGAGVEQVLLKKREASVQEGKKIGGACKKPYLGVGSVATIKSEAIPNNAPVFESKPCLFVENIPIQKALSFYERPVENSHQSQQRIVDLEAELEGNEKQWNKKYDELHTKWQVRLTKKSEEVEKHKVDIAVSDGLLKARKTTVPMQDKQLRFLEPTSAPPEEKESTIKDLKAQLAKSQSQARATLGPLFYSETSSSRTNKRLPTPAHKANTKSATPIPKVAGTNPPPEAPLTKTSPIRPNPPSKHSRPNISPHRPTQSQRNSTQVPKTNATAILARARSHSV